ncbi:MAG: hypothetical protein KGL35_03415 [Bradyrhizobium sp.]|uniref:hypothetical protein n=1 Tax=Bradyrhizobium sp. TaxID=376 RepID=UPI001C29A974|nr:hypothetical protein [Bradyrhizobium sp.]MBU6461381.1 hypothetical protein [Pseudomonadota bacterium]MDE2066558.1 hypothetical protein [Bradyrhizobium sp.]MDE2467796.1 hypothetical protein [Bradyrhizobium sp.]
MPERSGYKEVEAHKINAVLNDIGKAFLTLEDYYANGAEVIEPEYPEPELNTTPTPKNIMPGWRKRSAKKRWAAQLGRGSVG